MNMKVQLSTTFTDPKLHNTQCYSQTTVSHQMLPYCAQFDRPKIWKLKVLTWNGKVSN